MANVGTRDYFLSDIPLEKAQQNFMARVATLGGDAGNFIERIKIHDSVNRVLSENVFAEFSSPILACSSILQMEFQEVD